MHSPDFYAGDPYPTYRELRNTTPVVWNDVTNFWALLKYEDVRFVSGHPHLFSSTKGISIPDPALPTPVQEGNLIFTDPPRHRQLRKLINSGFTRRQVTLLEPKVREIVRGILDGIDSSREYEFADEIAAPLPTRMIAELLGAPPEDWERFRVWSDAAVGTADPEIEMDHLVALGELYEYFTKLIAARRSGEVSGQDDLLSILAAAEVDGERLSDEDLLNFSFLLLVAGNETTRNLIALGTLALIDHPDQFALLRSDPALLPSAVEEMLRYTSPVTHMARCATEDVEIRGQQIKAGDTVVMLYGAANRDEEIFGPTSEEFDITRNPNPHIAFGAGEHACLGAQLARLEARVMFEVLLGAYPSIELTGDVTRLRATMVPGVKRMPIRLGTGA
ncbi:cytochrome P450 [Mycobacterium intermedium]|uniref:Cytochrome P450 n=1 Tax=Mycobacterium intermedium TaxID=28445 RepID=A0A1E3SBX1_MYCIE|nr:cytochrome P450 [Mycobacterium intermedium]MCV6967894.1 cytochrome P450 [Mycobacterium intermedium]ODQ99648.1 cytochrome [Mycobacterium intermedium]OPE49370.1 cytochrome P450 [Mycobacterium intermedium]ORB09517.1 cytochrome P450 [Mycobacterium intermedium]